MRSLINECLIFACTLIDTPGHPDYGKPKFTFTKEDLIYFLNLFKNSENEFKISKATSIIKKL